MGSVLIIDGTRVVCFFGTENTYRKYADFALAWKSFIIQYFKI
jgi:hypothetical protein